MNNRIENSPNNNKNNDNHKIQIKTRIRSIVITVGYSDHNNYIRLIIDGRLTANPIRWYMNSINLRGQIKIGMRTIPLDAIAPAHKRNKIGEKWLSKVLSIEIAGLFRGQLNPSLLHSKRKKKSERDREIK